jgi:hypothetical protein
MEAQKNYLWMEAKARADWIPANSLPITPLKYKTMDESYYSFTTPQEVLDFASYCEVYIFTVLQSAIPIIEQVNSATTVAELKEITDTR